MKKYIIIVAALAAASLLFFYRYEIKSAWESLILAFASPEKLKSFVLSFGYLAPIVFLVVQIVQVIVAPIPGNVTIVIGGAMFGAYEGMLLSCTGILTGSIIAFYLARIFGKPLVIKLAGREVYEKYESLFHKKGIVALLLIFLFPFFPDDALCLLAGLSPMSFLTFMFLVVAGRIPGVIAGTLVGIGAMKFTAAQWAAIAAVSIALIYAVVRYGHSIEDWLYKMLKLGRKTV